MTRDKLDRAQQIFNYGLAVLAVVVIVALVVISPRVRIAGIDVPVLVLALLVLAFLFGLGQMVLGVSRRRRYLRSLRDQGDSSGD